MKAGALCTVIKQLRNRIIRLLKNGSISDKEERQKIEFIIKTKKWNPYCIRHSAITSDSDFLPDFALKKKVRWAMGSRQATRYIKRRMGNDLKEKILVYNGIISESGLQKKPSVLLCPRCNLVNAIDNKYCSCGYPLIPSAFEEINAEENKKYEYLEKKYEEINSTLQNVLKTLDNVNQVGKNEIAKQLIESGTYRKTNFTMV
jgi:hypothetical protein